MNTQRVGNSLVATCLLVFLGCVLFPGKAAAQFEKIRFPSPAWEGHPIVIEMQWGFGQCGGFRFTSSLHGISVSGSHIEAVVDAQQMPYDWAGGICPPPGNFGWESFHLPPMAAGVYDLSIYRYFPDADSPTAPELYAEAVLSVAAVPAPPHAQAIPASGPWGLLIMCSIVLGIGVRVLRAPP